MKSCFVYITAALMMAACSGSNKSEVEPQSSDSVDKADSVEIKANADSIAVDGVSSATNVANSPTFNGVMMVSPQQNATLSLTRSIYSISSRKVYVLPAGLNFISPEP